MDTGSVPLLWAIVRVPCEAVDSVSLVADTSGCLSADWERPRYQSAWEVRFVLPNGSELVESVDTNHWEYCGLLPGRTIRCICARSATKPTAPILGRTGAEPSRPSARRRRA